MLFNVYPSFPYRTIPVIVFKPAVSIDTDLIPLDQQMNEISSKFDITYHICFNVINEKLQSKYSLSAQ